MRSPFTNACAANNPGWKRAELEESNEERGGINKEKTVGGKKEKEKLWEAVVQGEFSRVAFGYQAGLGETI